MDDLCESIIRHNDHIVIAAMQGNAGAGGCFLALAADIVMARDGVVLNPHYKNMGNLYGSEYWTYLLPRRIGGQGIAHVMSARLPLGAREALELGLIDFVGARDHTEFEQEVAKRAAELASTDQFETRLAAKRAQREADETVKPLDAYRAEELERMQLNFFGFDPSYHVARYRFVHHTSHAWTPLYLAPHRRVDWVIPTEPTARDVA
ncbi:MAG TPA: enoyl-CoA hydratase/isomerase family protein, partial [Pseudomonadales bacterium]|nr:enoyl-CoA hydratase/isomerase family protein [Pseudomonadales bacterium]